MVVAVVAALAAAVWALGDPAPNPGGAGALPPGAGGTAFATAPEDEALSTPSAAPNEPVELAHGVTLHPGDDGIMPVSVRWVRHLYGAEAIAVDGDTVYAVAIDAFHAADGTLQWRALDPSLNGFEADGGVVIGTDGPDRLRVSAPADYELTLDRGTGEIEDLHASLDDPLTPFPAPRPTAFRIGARLRAVVARDASGAVAWRISVARPESVVVRPIAVSGGMVLLLSSGDLVALDAPASS